MDASMAARQPTDSSWGEQNIVLNQLPAKWAILKQKRKWNKLTNWVANSKKKLEISIVMGDNGRWCRVKETDDNKENGQSMKGKVTILINFAALCVHSDIYFLSQWWSPSKLNILVVLSVASRTLLLLEKLATASAPLPFFDAFINILHSQQLCSLNYFQCQFPAWLAINRINAWQKK